MNKPRLLLLFTLLSATLSVQAAFTLNGTRFVYPGDKKSISIQVTNDSDKTYGGQVWIENGRNDDSNVYFAPSPTFFKVSPKGRQTIRILNINPALSQQQETIQWLNVQEIPPNASVEEKSSSNILSIALNTRVKLFYRPEALQAGRAKAEQNISRTRTPQGWALSNPTPYYFAVTSLSQRGESIPIADSQQKELVQFAPYSQVTFPGNTFSEAALTLHTIDDYGAEREYVIQ